MYNSHQSIEIVHVFRFATMYNYTRKIQHCGDYDVYLFTSKTSALRYSGPDLCNRPVQGPKS